jgi:NADP-dependent 3-hydroxy acid dehydrogenase YdfG
MGNKFYHNKVTVITGASSGIGKAIAIDFAGRGSKVVLGARREELLKEVVDTIRLSGGDAIYCTMDVTEDNLCKKLIDTALSAYGKIDILVCNAGISMRANFNDVNMDVLRRLMDVNFWGAVYCVKHALPCLVKHRGNIVGISSIAGIHGLPGRTGYSASKFALTGFLETVRIENIKNKLHVMIAVPGFTTSHIRYAALTADGSQQGDTPRDEGKMMSAETVAKYIARGVRRRKHYLLFDMEGKMISFVKKIRPSLLDIFFYRSMAKEPNSPLK